MGGTQPGATLAASVGIEIEGGHCEQLLSRGQSLPASATETFTTAEDNQQTVQIRLFQGDQERVEGNELLGECTVSGLVPAPAGVPDVAVTFTVDRAGVLQVSVQNGTGDATLQIEGQREFDGVAVETAGRTDADPTNDVILGVDLGTTASVCAVPVDGEPEIVVNSEGDRATPSVLSVDDDGTLLVGKAARKRAISRPEQTIASVKRVLLGEDGTVELGEREYSTVELAGMLFEKLRSDAESAVGRPVEKAVVTVPAVASVRQRGRIDRAGEIAGLEIERTIGDAAAAVMGYAYGSDGEQTVLVCDLGGGSLSVSLLDVENDIYEIVANGGDDELGGNEWDAAIVDHLADQFEADHGIDLREDPQARRRLADAAAAAKIELASRERTRIDVPYVAATDDGPLDLNATLTRDTVASLTEPLVERVVESVRAVLSGSRHGADDIDEILLVGGASRLPQVRNRIETLVGQQTARRVNEEVTALGTAVQAGILSGAVDDVVLLDVTSLSLGIAVEGGGFERIVERGETIPTVESVEFTTTVDDQTAVPIRVFQGEHETATRNELLAEFVLTDVPPTSAGTPAIEVTVSIDENRWINVEADHDGDSEAITIDPATERSLRDGTRRQSEQERPAPRLVTTRDEDEATASDESPETSAARDLETLIDEALDVRNQLHRGVLYCRRSIDNEVADLRDNLEKTTRNIESIVGTNTESADKRDEDGEEVGDRLVGELAAVEDSLRALLDEDTSTGLAFDDLEALVDRIDRGLEAAGLVLVDPDGGAETDPYRHRVVSSTESSVPEGRIVSVQQIGYERDGAVCREATVVVSAGSPAERVTAATGQTDPDRSGDTLDRAIRDARAPAVEQFPSPPRRSVSYEDFEISATLGTGGQAVVYETTHPAIESPARIALKEPARGERTLTHDAISSFLQRAQTWRTVDDRERESRRWRSHEYIVGVVDVGDTRPWIAMEYMDGGDLAERLDGTEGLPVEEAVWIGQCLCRALEVAHEYGIAHLDIKPGNVLFTETTPSRWDLPKLADWGLARKLLDRADSMEGFSRHFAAPEQFDAETFGEPDAVTDIYQVGAVLYAMLRGEPPVSGGRLAVRKRIVRDDGPPPAPSADRDDVPPELDEIVRTALATAKRDRYESIRYLRDDLEALWKSPDDTV
ncbi:nucleotide exchange factor GrpE [Halomicrobium mukohataei]|uniref:Heat shock protein 70 n=2 Tax=Halomicrobium mukohataei TaxID=57705 RepID=C7P4U6_HALMD|nr:nucleotide exchange factor GrpE [Halomicrobium mukohataei]ACV49341.1 Heat shock protein 70 [Halomicrobium mukohataei DSM 12286]QCD67179.1 nucleotide exchange factor GrpE [Halomicrobium mukohataei]